MNQKFENISMNGRMAYVIMCVEAWLQGTYPDRDWTIVSEAMWKATEMNWGESFDGRFLSVILQEQ